MSHFFSIFKNVKKKISLPGYGPTADLDEIDIFLETHKLLKLTRGEINTVGPPHIQRCGTCGYGEPTVLCHFI